jgi:replication factor C subunit 3/5
MNSLLRIKVSLSTHINSSFLGSHSYLVVITKLKTERGLALQDLLTGAYEYLDTLELKPRARIYLLDHLATAE